MNDKSPVILAKLSDMDTPDGAVNSHVRQWALRMGARVVLFRSIYKANYEKDAFELSERQRKSETRDVLRTRSQLNACAESLRRDEIDVDIQVNWRTPHDSAFRHLTSLLTPDIILCGHIERPLQPNDATGSANRSLSTMTASPVAYVDKPPASKMTGAIWAAVDPLCRTEEHRRLNDLIIEKASRMAELISGELHLVHCYSSSRKLAEVAAGMASAEYLPSKEIQRKTEQQHKAKLLELAGLHGISSDHVHNLAGVASVIIPALAARHQPDLVFAGARQRGLLDKLLYGSTAKKLLQRMPAQVCFVHLPHPPQGVKSPGLTNGRAKQGHAAAEA